MSINNRPTVRFDLENSRTTSNFRSLTITNKGNETLDRTDASLIPDDRPYLIRNDKDKEIKNKEDDGRFLYPQRRYTVDNTSSDDQQRQFRTQCRLWLIRFLENEQRMRSYIKDSISSVIRKSYIAVRDTLFSSNYERRHELNVRRNELNQDSSSRKHLDRGEDEKFHGEISDDQASDHISFEEEKSLGTITYHSVLWEEVSVGENDHEDSNYTGIRLITRHTSRATHKPGIHLNRWHTLSGIRDLDLSTNHGRFVLDLFGIIQLAYSILMLQILCVYQKQCILGYSNEDAAVIMPKAIQKATPILAATHAIISPCLLMYGIPRLITHNKTLVSSSCWTFQLTRSVIITYFITCAIVHIILGCVQCLVVTHGRSFYVQSLLYQLQKRYDQTSIFYDLNSTLNFQNSTRIAQFWTDRTLSDRSVFCYDLTFDNQKSINQLASKQIVNEWSRLLFNIGMCLLDIGPAILLLLSWKIKKDSLPL